MAKRALVCGGRDFNDKILLYNTLDTIHATDTIELLIHGGARGADALAEQWAKDRGVNILRYMADWKTYGKSAGPLRNQCMLRDSRPDVVIAFQGGRGTADMARRAEFRSISVIYPTQ